MIQRLDGPKAVLVCKGIGKITRQDFQQVLEPALKAMLEEQGEARFVFVLGDEFEGYTLGAELEDWKVALTSIAQWHKWKRYAVVTNHDWIRQFLSMFHWMMPNMLELFDPSQLDEAIAWAAS